MKMVTDERLNELRHPYHTNLNESLNMRCAEVAPKNKNFSRSNSLTWRIQHVVGVHNMGAYRYYVEVYRKLNIDPTYILELWLRKKEKTKNLKRKYREKPENKRKRVYKRNAKSKELLLQERCSDPKVGTYGAGIGAHGINETKDKENTVGVVSQQKRKRSIPRMLCTCGGSQPHKNKSSKYCIFSKKCLFPKPNDTETV